MSGTARAVLYSRELLALAVELADRPHDPGAPLQAEARSRTCGSTLALSAHGGAESGLEQIGLKVAACAVGQAAAAIFAAGAEGRSAAALAESQSAIERWLAGSGALPDWPRLFLLTPALDYPARHAAILLPWRAGVDALSNAPARG